MKVRPSSENSPLVPTAAQEKSIGIPLAHGKTFGLLRDTANVLAVLASA